MLRVESAARDPDGRPLLPEANMKPSRFADAMRKASWIASRSGLTADAELLSRYTDTVLDIYKVC